MVWGLPMSAPPRHECPPPLTDAPIPASAECSSCETTVVLAAGQLPRRWVLIQGEAFCPDCAPKPALARSAFSPPKARRVTAVPARGKSKYRGCRIEHEAQLGLAALLIRAGAVAPEGRDEAVSFLLDAHELDELIIHLASIRDQVLKTGPVS